MPGFLLGLFLLFWSLAAHDVWTLSFSEIEANAAALPVATVTPHLSALLCWRGWKVRPDSALCVAAGCYGRPHTGECPHPCRHHGDGRHLSDCAPAFPVCNVPNSLNRCGRSRSRHRPVAATIALVQTDIKKVLAYSTVSQLGYMFLGLGVGAYAAGVFHVMTHAFFKALLFLGAGSVIHGMSDEQDIRKMGGLKRKMPTTYGTLPLVAWRSPVFRCCPDFSVKTSSWNTPSAVRMALPCCGWLGPSEPA